jgi:hypothetical protein
MRLIMILPFDKIHFAKKSNFLFFIMFYKNRLTSRKKNEYIFENMHEFM